MFEQLQNRFKKIFKTVRGHGKISESNIEDAIREIRIALLESDVNFKVVSSFIDIYYHLLYLYHLDIFFQLSSLFYKLLL